MLDNNMYSISSIVKLSCLYKCQDDGVVTARVSGSYFICHNVSPPAIEGVHVDGIGRLTDLIKKFLHGHLELLIL